MIVLSNEPVSLQPTGQRSFCNDCGFRWCRHGHRRVRIHAHHHAGLQRINPTPFKTLSPSNLVRTDEMIAGRFNGESVVEGHAVDRLASVVLHRDDLRQSLRVVDRESDQIALDNLTDWHKTL